ncbi:MAG: glycerol-3-phosphate dehydrogenase/oxidase [Candidatus Solibacter usitatus]|nr:glycerol-3-phosphate dehydrogenase/oxidase [Candidatus Solibacter usitatus]
MGGFPADWRTRSLDFLRDRTADILILGGGINGAGIARDFGLRKKLSAIPQEIVLVDQGHFGSGTSGKNSHLIHGGLRYLKYGKIGLVRESLRERMVLRRIAPHLVEPLGFLLPFQSRFDKLKYLLGLRIYDKLAGENRIVDHRVMSTAEIADIEPRIHVERLCGGALFYDCRVRAARLVLENLFEAASNGISMANYTRAELLGKKDGVWTVQVEDRLSGITFESRAKHVIDATGAWSNHPKPRLVRGSHLILPRLTSDEHAISWFHSDGRIVFFIPWGSENQLTLLGTTDVEHDNGADRVGITKAEIAYLMGIARRLFPQQPVTPIAAFSSLRPLLTDGGSSPTAASREHKIAFDKDRVLHVQGGKYTIYRQMSEEAVGKMLKEIAPWLSAPCKTAVEPIGGHGEKAIATVTANAPALAEHYGLPRSAVLQLIGEYGVETPRFLEHLPGESIHGVSRIHCGMLAYAVHREMAVHLADTLFVSTTLGYERPWQLPDLQAMATVMGMWLNWDTARVRAEAERVLRLAAIPQWMEAAEPVHA